MLKKMLCVLVVSALLFTCCSTAFAADASARLYTAYGDGMLFKQNEPATLAGIAENGSKITATLLNSQNEEIASSESTAANGVFDVSFDGMPGGYDTYTVVLEENGKEFDKLENVVFGELWLASGQSNMMYPLIQAKDGTKMFHEGKAISKWLRVYMEPAYPTYNSSDKLIPADPQPEIINGHWITGENAEVYSMSAVGYFFAEKLMQELDMPVGILNSSLGGSSIISWIPREAIDSDETLKGYLTASGEYIEKSVWKESEIDIYNSMCANYNLRTYSYRNFRVSGMIWYQGETDLIYNRTDERYARELYLMQRSYAELFNYEDGLLPLVYTQLAPYYYTDNEFVLPQRNYAFALMQQSQPDSRAVTSLYDVPVTFLPELGVIHPEHKTEVGQRMALAAMGLVYGKYDTYTAATPESTKIKDGSIYIKLRNTGNGLKADGDVIRGFTVCGDDGIHIPAKAEIVSADTVRVWNESITEPKSASYAYCVTNIRSNLYSTQNGELALPVSPFDTNPDASVRYWRDATWMDCDSEQTWHNHFDNYSAYYPTWTADNAEIRFSSDSYSGTNALNITSDETGFTANPVLSVEENGFETECLHDVETDYSDYDTLSFYVKNNGSEDVTFEQLKIFSRKTNFEFYSPAVAGTKDVTAVIPADGQWHRITLDLNRLYMYANECTPAYPNDKLEYTGNISFCFSSGSNNADISIDCVELTASNERISTRFDSDISNADNLWEIICGFFTTVIGSIINLFTK